MKHKYSNCILLEQRLLFSLFDTNSVTKHEFAKFSLPFSRLFWSPWFRLSGSLAYKFFLFNSSRCSSKLRADFYDTNL